MSKIFDEFMRAVKCGDLEKAKLHYENDYLDKPDIYGMNAIHWASLNNHVDVLNWLLKKNCNPEACNEKGWRPIHCASLTGHSKIIELLVQKLCDINCKTKNGDTPLDIASGRGSHMFAEGIISSNVHAEVADAMELKCGPNCNHQFCSLSLSCNTFKKGEEIGVGEFGKVYKMRESNSSRLFAMKQIEIQNEEDIDKEAKYVEENINKCQEKIKHDKIVRYFGVIRPAGKMFVFMEYMAGGSLKDEIVRNKQLPEKKIARYSKDILQGLAFLHSNRIIHRNIRASNILLDENCTCKLSDFAFSRLLSTITKQKTLTVLGYPNYMAPEIINGKQYSFPCDIWSMGCTVIEMMTGHPPYHNLNKVAVLNKIGKMKSIPYTPLSEEMDTFMGSMLQHSPKKRDTADKLLACPFILHAPTNEVSSQIKDQEKSTSNVTNDDGHGDCVDIIKRAIINKKVGQTMGLTCESECDHIFCLLSFTANKFIKKHYISHGSFGSVFLMKQSITGKEFAMKLITVIKNKNTNEEAKYVEQNINKHIDLINHERILHYFGAIRKKHKIYIFMEYLPMGSLGQLLKKNKYQPLEEIQIKLYCRQILEALAFIHGHNIIHRDIKADNILLKDENNIKLADFGESRRIEKDTIINSFSGSSHGTFNYMAPEIMLGEEYSNLTDIWSLGATMVEMATGRAPYHDEAPLKVVQIIANTRKIEYNLPPTASPKMKIFINQLLKADPKERVKASKLLQSEFLQ